MGNSQRPPTTLRTGVDDEAAAGAATGGVHGLGTHALIHAACRIGRMQGIAQVVKAVKAIRGGTPSAVIAVPRAHLARSKLTAHNGHVMHATDTQRCWLTSTGSKPGVSCPAAYW